MSFEIKISLPADVIDWDAYVIAHQHGSAYHHSAWGRAIHQTYGHQLFNLMASDSAGATVGVLPLVHIKHFLFGNSLFSMPFADLGGMLADNAEVEKALLVRATKIASEHDIPTIELRQAYPLAESVLLAETGFKCVVNDSQQPIKVRMLLDLPDSSEQLMDSFKSKLRSQIRRPLKDGLIAKVGGIELLKDFYIVFAENMRDLGSPVHSKKFIENLLNERPVSTRIFIVYKDDTPLAGSFTLGHSKILANPWASSLRRYSRFSPNMLLYWSMLEYACDNGFTIFDFGRSTPDEGTYKFKKQWGAKEQPLCWQVFTSQTETENSSTTDKSKFDLAMRVWKKLPVSISKVIGPAVRKNIGL
jgi:serine/alanine adding enzyme